jgi:hypothetical protein
MLYFNIISGRCVPKMSDLSFPRCEFEDTINTYASIGIVSIFYLLVVFFIYRSKIVSNYEKFFAVFNIVIIVVLQFYLQGLDSMFLPFNLAFILLITAVCSTQHILILLKK